MPSRANSIGETCSKSTPIYQVFQDYDEIGAAFTGKGTAPHNRYFSFERPPRSDSEDVSANFQTNLKMLADSVGFEPRRVTLPNGAWPHSGQTIKAEQHIWITNPRSGTIMPTTSDNQPVTYDAIVTGSHKYVLAAQGADCPQVFLFDPRSRIIGIAHAGWKPLVRGVIPNTIKAMVELGARAQNVLAYISPGAGDKCNRFAWDAQMEPHISEVFVKADRIDLLRDLSIRHRLTCDERFRLSTALDRDIPAGATSFKLSTLAIAELEGCGLLPQNISYSADSTIVEKYCQSSRQAQDSFKYHSYRREKPKHGLSIGVIFLKVESNDS